MEKLPQCPIEVTLSLIGNKWTIILLRDLMEGTCRFSELKRSAEGISQKVLASNLREMERHGLLTRKVYAEVPPRVEYTLSALGFSLKPVLDSLLEWGQSYRELRYKK